MKERPAGITIIALLAIFGGLLALLSAISGTLGAWTFGAGITVTLFYGIYSLVMAVLYLLFAWGMWQLQPWAWTVGIAVSILSIIGNIYSLISGNSGALIALLISVLVLWYLFQPRVRQAFARG